MTSTYNPPGHPKGTPCDIETRAKISTTLLLKNARVDAATWDKLYRLTLERMKLIEEISGNTP